MHVSSGRVSDLSNSSYVPLRDRAPSACPEVQMINEQGRRRNNDTYKLMNLDNA